MITKDRPLWELLLLLNDEDKPVTLTCGECFMLLDYDAERLAAGMPPNTIRPAVKRHLALCLTCKRNFDEWLNKLKPN